jgi:hypothetical protein
MSQIRVRWYVMGGGCANRTMSMKAVHAMLIYLGFPQLCESVFVMGGGLCVSQLCLRSFGRRDT